MFRPSRSSSGPSRTQIQALFCFPALWDPKCLQVSVTGVKKEKAGYRHQTKINKKKNPCCAVHWAIKLPCQAFLILFGVLLI